MDRVDLHGCIDRAVTAVAVAVAERPGGCATSGQVSYVEFGRWYNEVGHRSIPWVELLDSSKWPNVAVAAPESAGDDDEDDR